MMTTERSSATALDSTQATQQATSSRAFQQQCLDAAERFSEHLLTTIDGLSETLYQMADQADDHELRRLYFTALQAVYNSRSQIRGDFKKQFLAAVKSEIQQQPDRQRAALFARATIASIEQLTTTPHQSSPTEEVMPTTTAQSSEDPHSHLANTLPKGSWVEFHYPDKPVLKARFTWVNPTTGVYLFIDRDGRKAPDRTAEALAAAFRDGHATLIQNAAQLSPASR